MTTTQATEIRQVARAALAWASTHRADFALGEDALAADGQVNSSWKPLGELAQVCASVTRHTPPADPLHTCARDLLAFAWRQTGEGELFLLLQRLEPFATYPLEVYAALAAAGFRHPVYEAATATVARTRGWQLTEQEPTRRLGVLKAEERGGVHRDCSGEQVLRRTWLGGLPEPWTFERSAGYALTHVVFHLTDWGRAPQGFPSELTAYLADWLPPWLDTCLDARMWDLSCELLAVAASVPGLPDDAVPADAWGRIAAAQDATGALPEEGDAGDPEAYFAHHYHSTLMAAFAAALTAGQGAPV
ncbi:hypothetical protein SAMN06272771_0257 [Streptomyces sp. Ag82_O1-12]|uniref:DUF6895 family protein n=1 Tax=unclassified Streptomyces TaxID=2593676 RepID=UPI000BC52BA4|nr:MULTISPECIES: hypothetical protein [unclassified Streptomyces]SMQ13973.1 hypothetical protein SAMN06272771_0257 [Streptomyces sp. Ag82_O1-12]SOD43002.1 hypothetical protein SAMN06272727_0247 [Streptomyces sp. Ag82_G6-1]